MKKGRLVVSWLVVAIMIVATLCTFSCGGEPAPPGEKTVKVGVVAWLGFPIGLNMVQGIEVMANMINEEGGLDIGGEKYEIELIVYDSGADLATEQAAVNRLIFEDKANFILTDGINVAGWFTTAEENKVITIGCCGDPTILAPDYNYTFQGGLINCASSITGWFANNYPDKKTVVVALPDNPLGHIYAALSERAYQTFGMDVLETIFYPAESQDLSAVGTKVKTLNPDVFEATTGGPILDGLAMKACWQAGYEGQLYAGSTQPFGILAQVIPAEALEGFISGAWPVEFEPALTEVAQEFKDAWIAEHGEWTSPEIMGTTNFACLVAALQQAGSLDTDEVAAVIGNGLKFEGPTGSCQMVPRLDMGNSRTIDSVVAYPIKQVVGGKITLLDTISIDEITSYFQQMWQ